MIDLGSILNVKGYTEAEAVGPEKFRGILGQNINPHKQRECAQAIQTILQDLHRFYPV